jgi:Meiotically up-regulated gene 113
VLTDTLDHTSEADAQGAEDKRSNAQQDLNKLAADLFAARPTNWCDIVARAELAAYHAPNEYSDDKPSSNYRSAVAELIRTIVKHGQRPELEPSQQAELSVEEEGCVYFVRSGQRFKIGRTNALKQRVRMLQFQLPEKLLVIHHIKTEDPPGIETYWHRRFASQRKNGEWFELSPEDVEAFKARAVM